ncbi:MAG TPA: PaaI family thioesterase [Lapillicoccus sp.]|nr:PaaI family thioesterase [Lapillicoccus sp.]
MTDIEQRIAESFARQGLMRHLGAELTHVGAGRVHIALPYRVELTQQDGYLHAGATGAIADTAGGYAAFTLFPPGTAVLTVEYKLNLVAPARGERLEAEGVVVKSGRTLTITRLEVYAVTGQERTLVATGQQTVICVPDRSAERGE